MRKRGGWGCGGVQKKNDPDCCCDIAGGNAGQGNMWGSHNEAGFCDSTTLTQTFGDLK